MAELVMYVRTNVAFEFEIIENPQLVSQEGHHVNFKFRYVVKETPNDEAWLLVFLYCKLIRKWHYSGPPIY